MKKQTQTNPISQKYPIHKMFGVKGLQMAENLVTFLITVSILWLTGNCLRIFFPTRFHWEFGCFAVVPLALDKYTFKIKSKQNNIRYKILNTYDTFEIIKIYKIIVDIYPEYYTYIDMLDGLDKNILQELLKNARISNAELARRVNLSAPATFARVRRLEKNGIIQKYVTVINRKQAGYGVLCFINVRLQLHEIDQVKSFHEAIKEMPMLLECHHITGHYDYLLKVVARSTDDLEDFLLNKLTPIPGIAHIHTCLVLSEVKSSTAIPLEQIAP